MLAAPALLAVALTACGTGGVTDAGPVPTGATSTTAGRAATVAPVAGAGGQPGAPSSTAPAQAQTTTDVSVWLVRGEALEPVTRTVPKVARIGAEAVEALLAGPTAAETRSGLTTAVPGDARFLALDIGGDGIAKVDLSRDFEAGGGGLGITLRLAQVTCTVGQFPTVKGVRFALAGALVSVFSGDGIVLDKPVTCDSYRQVLRPPADPAAFAGIWPFATKAELDAYAGGRETTYRDPVATARDFAARYLGMDNPVTFAFSATGAGAGDVPIGPRYLEGRTPVPTPRATFTVAVRQLGSQGPTGPWTVVGASADDIVVAVPGPGDRVTAPVQLSGEALAFEGAVNVTVREDGMLAAQSLGTGTVTGGGDQRRPFSGAVAYRAPSKPAGAVAFVELSAADGHVTKAAVVRVGF
ncbi:MAG TPA: GerMN domain-containing protein [Acidimicrobiales bacterium]|nr:GerMN domain-containing protein [Acidimicrobiales bacterium]